MVLASRPHHSPSLDLHSKSKPKWVSLPHAKSINLAMQYFASTMSSLANCTYSLTCIYSLSRFKEEMRLANLLVAPFILGFSRSSLIEKMALSFASKIAV
jgi:hypothetical protein